MSAVAAVGFGALGVVVVSWLVVSFSAPSPRREKIEWIGACGLYVALLMLFVNLLRRALAADSTAGLVAFGFLVVLFGAGLLLSIALTVSAFRAPHRVNPSATN